MRLLTTVFAADDRARERAADEASARYAGPTALASALRRLATVDLGWSALLEQYAPLFEPAKSRASLVDGLDHLLAENAAPLAAATTEYLADRTTDWWDTHPPLGSRVAALEALAPNAVEADQTPAWTLLSGGREALGPLEPALLADDPLPLTTWDDVVQRGILNETARRFQRLIDELRRTGLASSGTLGDILDAAANRPQEFEGLFAGADEGEPTPRTPPEIARDVLENAAACSLLESGRARYQLSWTTDAPLVDATGEPLDLRKQLPDALPASVRALRDWLLAQGVDLGKAPGTGRDLADHTIHGVVTHVRGLGEGLWHLVVFGDGLLLLPVERDRVASAFGQSQLSELDRLSALLDLPVAQLKAVDRARWIPLEDIVSFGLKGKLIKVATLTLKDGTPMEVRVTDDTQGVDVGMEALGSLLAPVRTF